VTQQPTIFVVDDDQRVRDSLRWLLESVSLPVKTFGSAADFLKGCDPHCHGCLILDIRMPEMSGLQLQDILVERGIRLPIIMVSGHGDVPTAVRAMQKGAVEFLEKPYNDQVLLDRINTVLVADAQRHEKEAARREIFKRIDALTLREREVLEGVVGGKSNKQIATELDISVKTVEAHRARAMDKMAAKSVAELTTLCMLCGLGKGKTS
jgi:RNA polymerase sigma factor (sigma-70 family)